MPQEQIQAFEKATTNIQDTSIPNSGKRKICGIKKTHHVEDPECLEPNWKKPRLTQFPFFRNITMIPNTFTKFKMEDLLWIAAFNNIQSVPMWTGWNTRKHTEVSPQQLAWYMKYMRLPLTRADVVKETLKRSQIVAKECGQKYALVTYDLTIAKIAKRIHCKETPQFDNAFIMFGSFHIEMAFFSSLGKNIKGSGGPRILSESFVVALGSINKFPRGKDYNRCRCGHIILSAAIHGLHLEQFFEHNGIHENFIDELESWKNGELESDRFKHLFEKCVTYMEETMVGSNGKTADFWINYAYLMDMYLDLHRAMKMNDTQLFANCFLRLIQFSSVQITKTMHVE